MTHDNPQQTGNKNPKNQPAPSVHQIPLLNDLMPSPRAKITRKKGPSPSIANQTKITSRDPDYDPDSLDLFQEVFATLITQPEQTTLIEAEVKRLASEYRDQFVSQLSKNLVNDLTEIVDLLDERISAPKDRDL